MKILSWNVNGLRAIHKKGFLEWLRQSAPDILCLQETKSHPDQLIDDLRQPDGYHAFWSAAEKKGYSGVGVYSRIKPQKTDTGMGIKRFDCEGRVLMLDYGQFILLNVYFPNGGAGNKRVPFKMDFYDTFLKKCERLRKQGRRLIICGDVNTAHTAIDLARPKENEKNTGFLPEERAWVSKFLEKGYIDTFRHFTPGPGHYTWWDYKTKARERDIGWRIDYIFITPDLLPNLKKALILKQVMGSDHCPIGIDIQI